MKKTLLIVICSSLALLALVVLLQPERCSTDVNAPQSSRIIRDMTGREVRVPIEVHRVVTAMYPIATQLMLLVGAQDMLTGISDMDVNPVMEKIYPPIAGIYRPGRTDHGDISTEEVIKMFPDVVFTHTRKALINNYADLGIATISLKLETPEELIRGIELVGRVVAREERARIIADYYRAK
ncbi:MAG: hypothetical protein RRA35_13805, partial [Desulfomonilia bacterium]|nr:hypothetical protein [Desulfomonilia bacterium]